MDNRNQLLASIKKLRNSKYITLVSIDESILAKEDKIQEYFDAPFDSNIDIEFEKIVSAATIRSTYSSSFIPQSLKKMVAERQSRESVEALRYAKLDYLFQTEEITAIEYQKRLKINSVAQKIALVKACKKRILLEVTKISVGAAISLISTSLSVTTVAPAVVGLISWSIVTIIEVLIPQRVKELIKEGLREAIIQCVSMAKRAVEKLRETCQKIAVKVAPTIERVKNTFEKIGNSIKVTWETAKQNANKLWNKIFN